MSASVSEVPPELVVLVVAAPTVEVVDRVVTVADPLFAVVVLPAAGVLVPAAGGVAMQELVAAPLLVHVVPPTGAPLSLATAVVGPLTVVMVGPLVVVVVDPPLTTVVVTTVV